MLFMLCIRSLGTSAKTKTRGRASSSFRDISEYVRALCKQARLKEALDILRAMNERGIRPDSSIFSCLLQECVYQKALPEGKLVHAHMIDTGFNPDVYLETKLVIMYAKCGSLVDARQALERMPRRNVVSWTAMIAAYAKHGADDQALTLFYQMQRTGIQPDQFTFATVLPACANLAALDHGRKVHEDIITRGFHRDAFVESALVDMYVKCGSIDDARKVFDKMVERDVVSWNAMIAAYAGHGLGEEALALFYQMQQTTIQPEQFTFASVLPACANLAALKHGKNVHKDIIRRGFEADVFVASALVDMYVKCGSIEDAHQVFDKMAERDVVSWTAMIVGYAMHGRGRESLQLFERMQLLGVKPNDVTLLGVLSACCHAGLVDDGWQYFDRMTWDYHITPAVQHYCCMVDLLGRAGCLDEAEDLINKMPIKPDATVWGSLLGACRIHANVELGERVAGCLFELEPENAAHYVLLSNIYAVAGRWDDAENIRKMMQDRGLKKRPGRSWIEINNKVYSFLGGDRPDPEMQEVYEELERLSGQMREAGYMPDMNSVLHDVEAEQKKHILCHHSEKLAIVFGLIHTSPWTPIRIVKNLRVCVDCHSATKFISKIVVREIIVRDANRFHHFKDGQCSCRDYW